METLYKVAISFIIGFTLGWLIDYGHPECKSKLPSIVEVQMIIRAKPDGIPGPETMKLWNEYVGNQCYEDVLEDIKRAEGNQN